MEDRSGSVLDHLHRYHELNSYSALEPKGLTQMGNSSIVLLSDSDQAHICWKEAWADRPTDQWGCRMNGSAELFDGGGLTGWRHGIRKLNRVHSCTGIKPGISDTNRMGHDFRVLKIDLLGWPLPSHLTSGQSFKRTSQRSLPHLCEEGLGGYPF